MRALDFLTFQLLYPFFKKAFVRNIFLSSMKNLNGTLNNLFYWDEKEHKSFLGINICTQYCKTNFLFNFCHSIKCYKWIVIIFYYFIGGQIDRRTDWKKDRLTEGQINRRTDWQDRLTEGQIDRRTDWQKDRLTEGQIDRRTDCHNVSLTKVHNDRRTDWQIDKRTD